MNAIRFEDLVWEDAPMPGGTGPVRLAKLPDLADGAFRAFVRFPPGWSRPSTGHYEVIEEVLVLEGDLTFNSTTWGADGYAWIPAMFTRYALRTVDGALVLAWFSAPPRWRRGPAAEAPRAVMKSVASWRRAPLATALDAHVLRSAEQPQVWVSDDAGKTNLRGDLELLNLADRTWLHARAGEHLVTSPATFWRAI